MRASFLVGDHYEVECYWSLFGLEIYSVNGKQVLKKRGLSLRGSRRFVVGEGGEKHDVEIKLDMVPTRKSWIFPGDWLAQAYVDGELVVADLTPQLRQKVRLIDRILNWALIVAFSILAIVLFLYFVLRYAIPR